MQSIEIWEPVVGYEGSYEVSNMGSVRSLDRLTTAGRFVRGRVLRPRSTPTGYLFVGLYRASKGTSRYIHRLVLEAFVGPCPDGMEACHNDGIKANNALSNLRWDTHSENHLDIVRSGEHWQQLKTHCPRNHQLVAPNLTARSMREGTRECLACDRASANVQKNPALDFITRGDHHYVRIMSATSSPSTK